MTQSQTNKRTRGLALLVAIVAVAALVITQWELIWTSMPGRIGAPEATIAITVPVDDTGPEVRLAVLGDVGTGDADEWATANLVVEAASEDPFDGLVLLGDNAYPKGDPERLDATVFDPFGPVLDEGAVLLAVLGNHDVKAGNAQGQVDALGMPGRWYSTEIGSVLFIGLDSNLVDDPDQMSWLESSLADSESAQWVIVGMHHPAYSAGYHGSTKDVQRNWAPLFERFDVDLVLAGHDHDYQRIMPINGVTYIVSGGGSQTRVTDEASYTSYAAAVLHFLDITVWEDRIEVTAVSGDGPFDHVTITANE